MSLIFDYLTPRKYALCYSLSVAFIPADDSVIALCFIIF